MLGLARGVVVVIAKLLVVTELGIVNKVLVAVVVVVMIGIAAATVHMIHKTRQEDAKAATCTKAEH